MTTAIPVIRRTPVILTAALLLSLIAGSSSFVSAGSQQQSTADEQPQASQPTSAQHGEYLVKHVAMCIYCHSPRDAQGNPESAKLLEGAPFPLKSPFERSEWAFNAPSIAGLPAGYNAEQLADLLQTGRSPNGNSPQPPMPPFRMNAEDAAAVAEYLKSMR